MTELRPVQNSAVAWRELDGAVVIISPADNVLHCLNPTASLIWKLVDGRHTRAEIAACVAEEYEVSAEQALADTHALLDELAQKNLLQFEESSGRTKSDG